MQEVSVRTCIVCGKRFNQSALCRFALNHDKVPVYDGEMSMEGRGVYCCKNDVCLRSFAKSRKKLSRAFRQEIAGGFKIDLLLESGSFK